MTSSTTTAQETTDSRSVRDIVEHAHDQVNETWCRRIFRQLLQSLERQYAMEMPHRVITPDTVVFHDNGDPLLLPSIVDDPAPGPADDLTALAKLVHYAITQELLPAGPLHGRELPGYSDSLKTAVDRCMDPDPARRPHSIDELRDILGIVAPGSIPPAPPPPLADDLVAQPPASAAPAPAPDTTPATAPSYAMRASADGTRAAAPAAGPADTSGQATPPAARKRWPLVAGAVIALAIVLGSLAALRNGDQDKESDSAYNAGPPAAEPTTQAPADNAPAAAAPGTPDASSAPAAADPGQSAPDRDAGTQPAAAPAAPAAASTSPAANAANAPNAATAANGSASYRLQIQPWGTVYVDGVDRGVSPPVKRLVLAPGRHTVRVTNPNFRERVLEIDTAGGDGRIVVDFSSAE